MADTVRCKSCGEKNPADARFCIDCGASLIAATTGPTTKLGGLACPSCQANNPENARFCVVCGRDMGATAPKPAPARPTPSRPAAPPRPAPHIHPRMAAPPAPMPYRPAHPPHLRPHGHWQGGNPGNWVFLIGLFLLLTSHHIWPGILVVIGISIFLNQAARGRLDRGLGALLWLGGLALLFTTGSFWPLIVMLLLLHGMMRGWRW
jgi:hypothetical protein